MDKAVVDRLVQFEDESDDDHLFIVDPSVRARRREAMIVVGSRILLAAGILLLWEVASNRWISEFWISSPSRIATAFVGMWSGVGLTRHILATLMSGASGFFFGVVAGMALGLLCGINRIIAKILDPFLIGFYSMPRVALIPLFILWFGIGLQTKVIYAAVLVFFPVFMNVLSGVRDVNRDLIDVTRVMGASRIATVRKILIPSALAWLFAGLRISVSYALIGAIIAEMFSSNVGLGYLISYYANHFLTAGLFATLGVTTAIGLALYAVVSQVEKHLLRWRPAGAG